MAENLESQTDEKKEFVPASFIKRFAAAFGEYLFILSIPSILLIFSYIVAILPFALLYMLKFIWIFIIIIFSIFFHAYFETSHFKSTPFKMLLGLQVFNDDGREAGFSQIILKNIIIIIIAILFLTFINMPDYSGLPFLIPIFLIIIYNIAGISGWLPFKTKGQALHDQVAGTIILQKASFKNKVSIFSIILIPFILFLLTFNVFLMWAGPWLNIVTIPSCFNGTWMYRLGVEEYGREILPSVKSNMHTLQNVIEKYGNINNGIYPKSLQELSATSYWKEFTNPYCSNQGIGHALMDYEEYQRTKFHDKHRGFVLYELIGNPPKRYFIYGCDIKGELRYKLYNNIWFDINTSLPLLEQLFPFLIFDISYLR